MRRAPSPKGRRDDTEESKSFPDPSRPSEQTPHRVLRQAPESQTRLSHRSTARTDCERSVMVNLIEDATYPMLILPTSAASAGAISGG